MKTPKISLITCSYFRPDLLRRTIQSVQKQQFEDYEHIIVSDHCPFTEHVYNDFKEDNRINFIKNINPHIYNLGACSFNIGIENSKSPYISYVLDDDILYDNHLLEHFNMLKKGTEWAHSRFDNIEFLEPQNTVKNILQLSFEDIYEKALILRKRDGDRSKSFDVGALCHLSSINNRWIPQCESSGWEDTVFMANLGVDKKEGNYTTCKVNWGGIHRKDTKGLDKEYYELLMSKLVKDKDYYSGYKLTDDTPYVYPDLKNSLYGK